MLKQDRLPLQKSTTPCATVAPTTEAQKKPAQLTVLLKEAEVHVRLITTTITVLRKKNSKAALRTTSALVVRSAAFEFFFRSTVMVVVIKRTWTSASFSKTVSCAGFFWASVVGATVAHGVVLFCKGRRSCFSTGSYV